MTQKKFDPFADRLARDIRNALSTNFKHCLATMNLRLAKAEAKKFLALAPGSIYVEYINDRLTRYATALKTIKTLALGDPLHQSLALWDQGLFFEVHEVLEDIWLDAASGRRQVLQGLIRAAGTYVHLERGNEKTAAKMAAKAKTALEENRVELPDDFPMDLILAGLNRLDQRPPLLLSPHQQKS